MPSTLPAPTSGQMAILVMAAVSFAMGTLCSLLRFGREAAWRRRWAVICWWIGIALGAVALVWHAADRGDWVPLGDNFDALVWLALLLAGSLLYVQRRSPLRGLDWFIMPVVVLLLVAALLLGRGRWHQYGDSVWSAVHRIMTFGGSLAFFVAGAAGALYLISNWRLRHKRLPAAGPGLGSLERQEKLVNTSVTVGFALMTGGLITGLAWLMAPHGEPASPWWSHAKITLAACLWLVYALALHTPLTIRLRGRRAAILSIVGAVLTLGAIIAAVLGSGGKA